MHRLLNDTGWIISRQDRGAPLSGRWRRSGRSRWSRWIGRSRRAGRHRNRSGWRPASAGRGGVAQSVREVRTCPEPVIRILRQCFGQNRIQRSKIRTDVGKPRRRSVEMAADHHRRIRRTEHRRPGQKVISRRGQAVLVCTAVDYRSGELLGCGVVHRSQRDVGVGQAAHLRSVASNSEVAQQNPTSAAFGFGQQNIGRLDIAV